MRAPDAAAAERTELRSLLWPETIAVIGASADVDSLSGRPIDILDQHGFAGKIFAVNPRYESIGSRPCYPTIMDVPDRVDLALIVTNARFVADIVEACVKSNVKNVIILSSGFSETQGAEGLARQEKMNRALTEGTTRVLGPNTEGFMNVVGDIPGSFSPAVSYKMGLTRLLRGHLGVVAQSGGVGFGLFSNAMLRGVGISYAVTTGNETDLDINDFLDYLLHDPETRAIALFVEGFSDGRRFLQLARHASRIGKPILISKVGTSPAGSLAAQSHTAHMAGDRFVHEATFAHVGVLQCSDQDELLDKAAALTLCPLPGGNRVAVLTLSGGAGAWVADACTEVGLDLPPMSNNGQQRVRALIGDFGATLNPIDVTGMGVRSDGLAGLLEIVLSESDFDSVIVVTPLASSRLIRAEKTRLAETITQHGKPVLIYTYSPPHQDSIDVLSELGLPWYGSPARVAGALGALVTYAGRQGLRQDDTVDEVERLVPEPELPDGSLSGIVPEYATKAYLASCGVRTTREILVPDARGALAAAHTIGYPVVLKLQSAQLLHKSDIGGVALDIRDDKALRSAYAALMNAASALDQVTLDGVLVQENVAAANEVIVGTIIDPDFGPMIMLGTGGIYAEILNDRVFAPTPLSPGEATRLISTLKGFPILRGARGQVPGDLASLAELVSIVSRIAHEQQGAIQEIELNPVMVLPQGDGAVVVDALMTLGQR
jgi:acyl-CoA synthetase (NDP forming)